VLYRWGVAVARHRRAVLVIWLLTLVTSAALYPSLKRELQAPNYYVTGSESAHVERLLETSMREMGTEDDALVFESRRHVASDRTYRRVVVSVLNAVRRQHGVRGVQGPFDPHAVGQISSDEHAAVAVVALEGDGNQRFEYAHRVQSLALRTAKAQNAGMNAWLTGYSPITRDMVDVQSADVERAEAIGVPVAFVILVLALGALGAALVPLALAGAGLLLTYGVLALVVPLFPSDNFLVSIVTMIGVGIGIDYALIILSRFREELARITPRYIGVEGDGLANEDANAEADRVGRAVGWALDTSGRTILFSGIVLIFSITGLLVLNALVFREITVGVIVVVVCTLLAALTLLPAVLAVLGTRINSLALPAGLQPASIRPGNNRRTGGWARWAQAVMRHPLLAAAAVVVVLGLATLPVLGLRYGINLGVLRLPNTISSKGAQVLERSFTPGGISPIQVIVTGGGDRLRPSADVAAAGVLKSTLESDKQVSGVGERRGKAGVLLTVVPSVRIDSRAAIELVRHIRSGLAPRIRAEWGSTVLVGGMTAIALDLTHETSTKFLLVLALILGLSSLLIVAFRSLLLPLKAILMNLLATGSMIGLLVWVFQDGHGSGLLGFTSSGFIQAYVPLAVFALLFGLSMDYEVFLIRRIQEEWHRTHDNRLAVATGLEHTARPIAAAAAIMVAVFGSFVTANLPELKQLGFAIAAGIALDATLIRLVLVPALMLMFGTWNWWCPARLERILRSTDPTEQRSVSRHVPWGENSFRSEDIDPVAITSDSVGVASVDGSGLDYEDEARLRHTLS
jgi:RND superfamily putative drug exporter